MRTLRPSRAALCLGLILLLGAVARVPGLFWGYRFFGTDTVILYPDEPYYSLGRGPTTAFPRGLETNVRLLTRGLEAVGLAAVVRWPDYDFFVGRVVSLVYGVLTLVVLFRLARSVFKDDRIGLVAAFFLALADLHVTYSHIGIPDSAATFWFYAALASAHTALERGSRPAFVLSAVSTGAAAAMRFQLMSLIPLVWYVARAERRLRSALAVLVIVPGSFFVANGLAANPVASWKLLAFVAGWGDPGLQRLFLPLVYLAVMLLGVGLPVFLLAGYGLCRFVRTKWAALRGWRDLLTDNQVVICLAPVAAFLQVASVPLWGHRHVLVVVPFVAMLAAYGVSQLPRRAIGPLSARATARGLLALIGVYLVVQVASVQAFFVDDPLEEAGRWLRAHVPPGEVLSVSAAEVPREYQATAEWTANYLILSARGYRRYLFKDFLPARLTGRFPDAGEVWGGNPREALRVQKLFKGELPYRLVKRILPRFYTPELLLAQAVWYPPAEAYDVLIYERPRERERLVELLTPARKDYLLTLDPGQGWRLAPGQDVRLSVGGQPLPGRLGPGITHLVLPRALVSSPHSRLRLSSDLLLPHVPLDLVRRLRPLGDEFVVESLLDDDLMAEGFLEPEVGRDGATWRWTRGAGQVVLPGPGSAGPWRRLAVRVHGRPLPSPPGQPVVFFLNGKKLGEVAVASGARTIELPIPAASRTGGSATLEIVTSTGSAGADPGDTRRVGVAVHWLSLTRGERFRRRDHPVTPASFPLRSWRPLFGLGVPYRVEAVSFPSDGLTLRGDLFVPADGGRSAVVLAHGATPLGRKHGLYLGLARRLAEKGYWVLLPDFRGYGASERPSRIASARDLDFTEDLSSAITFLQTRLGATDLTVVGHSFGADVAISLPFRDPRARRVIAIAPARRVYQRFFNRPEGTRVMRDRMVAEMGLRPEQVPLELIEPIVVPITIDTYVGRPFPRPILLVDGAQEDEADLDFLRDIYRRMTGEKAYVTIPNADHYFGVQRELEERNPVTLGVLADVVDGWIREGTRWSRGPD